MEHRLLGLDNRSFPTALAVLAVFVVLTVVVPRIDDAVAWDDPVQAGERLALSPPSGAATLVGDGVTLDVMPGKFGGTPRELVAQIAKVTSSTDDPSFVVDGDTTTITAASGQTGVLQTYSSARGDGIVAAFAIDGTGVEIRAFGAPAQMTAAAPDIKDMIVSVRVVERADS